MAGNVATFPRLPTPQEEVDVEYLVDLVRALEVVINQLQNPQLNFQEVPANGNNNLLQQGDIYIADGGFLKVVGKTEIFSGSIEGTGSVGTVTVSVS